MKKRTKKFLIFIIILGVLLFWIGIFSYLNPQQIVAKLGAKNGYWILFLLGAIGGVSTFTGPSYFVALGALYSGGLNPILLALCGGFGVTIGDSINLFLGLSAGKKAPEGFKKKFEKLDKFLEKKPGWLVNTLLYFYIAFTPMPNEFATIPLGLSGYHPKKIILFIFLGNITSGFLGAILAKYGIGLFT